jgi:hypothetical protein
VPEEKFASLPAADPGSPGFRSVQPRSIFQRVVKPALHSGVAIICAASIAVNTVVVEGYAQTSPENPFIGDVANMPFLCHAPPPHPPHNGNPVCPVDPHTSGQSTHPDESSHADQGSPTVYVSPNLATAPNAVGFVEASPAAVRETVELAILAAPGQSPSPSPSPRPWYVPTEEDAADLYFTWVWSCILILATLGTFARNTMSAATDDGDLTEVQNGMLGKRVAGLTFNGLVIMVGNLFRIPIYLATYRLQKNKLLAQHPAGSTTPEINSRAAALSAASLWAIAMLAVQNELNLYVDGKIKNGEWKLWGNRRKLHRDILPEKGKIGDLMSEYFWHVNRIEFMNMTKNGKQIDVIIFPEFKRIGIPKTLVEIPSTLDLSGGQMRFPAEEIVEVNPNTWRTTKRPDILVNPAAFAQWPTKHVADKNSVWNLTGRGNFGYNIYKRPKYNDPKLTGEGVVAWKQVHGQALDLYPGPNVVWAVNALNPIYSSGLRSSVG